MPWQLDLPLAEEKPLAADESRRTITLDDRIVPYVLRRARRRTIGLTIDHRGLRVGAPRSASFSEVESLIRQHADWVAQKLDEWRSRRVPQKLRIANGTRLPFLGEPLELRLAFGRNSAFWNEHAGRILTLCLRDPADAARAGQLLEKTLRTRAMALFAERLSFHAPKLGVTVPRLSLTSARTRWGSCSLRTGIRLNWRLIHFPPHVIDYVVAHELAHLREMNHGPRFWALVGRLFPDYLAARNELKTLAAQCPHW